MVGATQPKTVSPVDTGVISPELPGIVETPIVCGKIRGLTREMLVEMQGALIGNGKKSYTLRIASKNGEPIGEMREQTGLGKLESPEKEVTVVFDEPGSSSQSPEIAALRSPITIIYSDSNDGKTARQLVKTTAELLLPLTRILAEQEPVIADHGLDDPEVIVRLSNYGSFKGSVFACPGPNGITERQEEAGMTDNDLPFPEIVPATREGKGMTQGMYPRLSELEKIDVEEAHDRRTNRRIMFT